MKNNLQHYGKSFGRILLIAILILIQFCCMVLLATLLKRHVVIVYFMIEVVSILVLLPLLSDTRDAAYKIYWSCIILLLPIVGHLMYDFWGKEKVQDKEHEKIQKCIDKLNTYQIQDEEIQANLMKQFPNSSKITSYLSKAGYPLYGKNALEYFHVGENAFEDILLELQNAKKYILISFFTIEEGFIWKSMCQVLEQKVVEGVQVKLMYDDAGSFLKISDKEILELERKGIEVIRFNSVEKNFHRLFLNYRNHQKIIVVDGLTAYTGGLSASDRDANLYSPFGHYKGTTIKLQGEATWSMTLIFLGMWKASEKNSTWSIDSFKPERADTVETGYCQPFADGPSNNPLNQAMDMYRLMIQEANKEVYIMTPYLILNDMVREDLMLSARSGIDVRIITPGKQDRKIMKQLTECNYGELLKAGVHIYEYVPGVIRAKICLNEFSGIVGTINLDYRSFYLHYECGVWSPETGLVHTMRQDFLQTIENCKEITYKEWIHRPHRKKITQMFLKVFQSQF